ncbi:4'-phosphopantetheinyl transferase superfamily protein [Streptomyces mirabilis]
MVGGDTRDVLGLGVDMEISPGPTPRNALLFLAEHEQQALATVPLPQWQDELRRVWTTKEALYKADPANQGIDLRRYTLDRPLARHGVARLASAAMPAFRYLTLDLPGGVLTAAVLLSQNGKTTRG